MTIEFNSQEVQQWVSQLEEVVSADVAEEIFRKAGNLVGIRAEELVGSYPVPQQTLAFRNRRYTWPNGTVSKFQSRKQQRKVFALIREGKIPYVRRGTLGRAIRSQTILRNNLVVIEVGTTGNVENYAEYILGLPPVQALVHQNVWTPLETTLEQNQDDLGSIFIAEVQKAYANL